MPEALAVVLVFVVAVAVYAVAWLQSRNPAHFDAAAELARLQLHEAWLRERLARAEREQWGADMIAGLAAELRATSRQLDCVRLPVRSR